MTQLAKTPVALDLDGVVWTGTEAIPGSARAVNLMLAAGHPLAFVTNNSFSTQAEQEKKFAGFGVDATGRMISSAMAAASMVEPGSRAVVLGGQGIIEALEARNVEVVPEGPVDAVLVGLDFHLTYDRMRAAVQAIRSGATFIGTNTDPTYPTEYGLYPGGGSIVAAVRTASEVEPLVAGKPHQPMADLVLEKLGPGGLMVGDRPDTDGLFAKRADYRFAMVLTGVSTAEEATDPVPDLIADDLAAVVRTELGLTT